MSQSWFYIKDTKTNKYHGTFAMRSDALMCMQMNFQSGQYHVVEERRELKLWATLE